jgi:hypothetical protein
VQVPTSEAAATPTTPEVTPSPATMTAGVGGTSSGAAAAQDAAFSATTPRQPAAAEPAGEPGPQAAEITGAATAKQQQQQQQQQGALPGQVVGRSATSPTASPRKGGCWFAGLVLRWLGVAPFGRWW